MEIPVAVIAESVSIDSLSGRWVGQINTPLQMKCMAGPESISQPINYLDEHGDSEAGHTHPILWLVGLAHA